MTVARGGAGGSGGAPENIPPAEEGVEASVRLRRGTAEDLDAAKRNGHVVLEFDITNPTENRRLKEVLAKTAEAAGLHEDAAHYRGEELDQKFMAKVGRVMNSRIQVKTVSIVVLGSTLIIVGWELLAWGLDWNFRFGMFGEKNTAPKLPTRRVA